MATRDENLKKINDELEKLDDEQLDEVAGGVGVIMVLGAMKDLGKKYNIRYFR